MCSYFSGIDFFCDVEPTLWMGSLEWLVGLLLDLCVGVLRRAVYKPLQN